MGQLSSKAIGDCKKTSLEKRQAMGFLIWGGKDDCAEVVRDSFDNRHEGPIKKGLGHQKSAS